MSKRFFIILLALFLLPDISVFAQTIPDMSGDVISVNAQQAQDVLDGKYGDINGKTIHFTEDITETLELARPTSYEGSQTKYYNHVNSGLETDPTPWSENISTIINVHSRYVRNLENVTFTAAEGVEIYGMKHIAGHQHTSGFDYVRNVSTGNGVTYYQDSGLKNIKFSGLTFQKGFQSTYYPMKNTDNEVKNLTFENCTFLGNKDNMKDTSFTGVKMLTEQEYYKDITVQNCTFNDYFQAVYIGGIDGVTLKNNTIDNTTHNAFALQSNQNHAKGNILIQENYISNVSDRVIRFNGIADNANITIQNNVMLNCGDDQKEMIKGQIIGTDTTISLENNYWDGETGETAVKGAFQAPSATGINGGTFKKEILLEYCADSFVPQQNEDGTYGAVPTYETTFTIEPVGAVIRVTDENNQEITSQADGTYMLKAGTYTYEITMPDYDTITDTFTITDHDIEITETLVKTTYFTVNLIVDGTIIDTKTVKKGFHVDLPAIPEKTGYDQTAPKWSHDGKNIQSDLDIVAEYTPNQYTVTYIANDTIIDTQRIAYGQDAKQPAIPFKYGYDRIAPTWNHDGKNITADQNIHAVYTINEYTVIYKADGKVISTQIIQHGKDASAPAIPEKIGFDETAPVWDNDGKQIVSDMTISAVYTKNKDSVNQEENKPNVGNDQTDHKDTQKPSVSNQSKSPVTGVEDHKIIWIALMLSSALFYVFFKRKAMRQ